MVASLPEMRDKSRGDPQLGATSVTIIALGSLASSVAAAFPGDRTGLGVRRGPLGFTDPMSHWGGYNRPDGPLGRYAPGAEKGSVQVRLGPAGT
jgi:hypothetical protein